MEVGFLRNVGEYDPDVTVCNTIEELNRLLPDDTRQTMYSGMAMRSNYDIAKLSAYDGHGIEMIRITAHDYDIREGMDFAREVKARGYKLSINPINIMGYADKDILWILDQVNAIARTSSPSSIPSAACGGATLSASSASSTTNLDPFHPRGAAPAREHGTELLLAQEFLDKRLRRGTTVDASLMGMGRIPGNLPIELVADYMNDTLARTTTSTS